jgi:hypothetical protein
MGLKHFFQSWQRVGIANCQTITDYFSWVELNGLGSWSTDLDHQLRFEVDGVPI